MGKGISTIGTVLKCGAATASIAELCKIKSYPDLGGAPDNLETTDLQDTAQTFCPGVQTVDQMEFTANYTLEDYESVLQKAGTEDQVYELAFGANGADGVFTWTGTHTVYVNGGDVNAVREMTIVCTPSSAVTKKA